MWRTLSWRVCNGDASDSMLVMAVPSCHLHSGIWRPPSVQEYFGKNLGKICILIYFLVFLGIFGQILRFLIKITWFLSFSNKNDAESLCHFDKKKYFLDPKRAKLDQKSEIRHVRTCQDLFYYINLSFFIKSSVLLNKFIIFIKSSVLLNTFIIFIKSSVLLNKFTSLQVLILKAAP